MRRADRLFQIVQYLRGRRLTTAAQLAAWLAVSERTVYRDVRDLSLSGVPVEGEAGVGYRLSKGFDLPPIMFTMDEVHALVAGARMVEAWGGPALAVSSRSAIEKIAQALPASRRNDVERTPLFAPGFHVRAGAGSELEAIRQAILSRHKLRLTYVDSRDQGSERVIRPLGLAFWGTTWTVAAWCESRAGFRNFRLDRIRRLQPLDETFKDEPGTRLEDFLAMVNSEAPPPSGTSK
jgi:predicted DNA-binding transcriptional regulator YafY